MINLLDWLSYVESQANKAGVKKLAVENFLMSIDSNKTIQDAIANLYYDAKLYAWNYQTIDVILKGIHKYFKQYQSKQSKQSLQPGELKI